MERRTTELAPDHMPAAAGVVAAALSRAIFIMGETGRCGALAAAACGAGDCEGNDGEFDMPSKRSVTP